MKQLFFWMFVALGVAVATGTMPRFQIALIDDDVSALPSGVPVSIHTRLGASSVVLSDTMKVVEDAAAGLLLCRVPAPAAKEDLATLVLLSAAESQPLNASVEDIEDGRIAALEELGANCLTGPGPYNNEYFQLCPKQHFASLPGAPSPRDEDAEVDPDQTSSFVYGVYDDEVSEPQWNTREEAWELLLPRGGPCRNNTSRTYSSRVLLRCLPHSTSGAPTTWSVAIDELGCVARVELGLNSVCTFTERFGASRKITPIPCFQLEGRDRR